MNVRHCRKINLPAIEDVVTFAELRHGIERLPAGRRRRHLDAWLRSELPQRFEGRVALVDAPVATLRFDHFESLAPGSGRQANIETDNIEGTRIVIGGDQRRRQLEAICGSQRMHAQ